MILHNHRPTPTTVTLQKAQRLIDPKVGIIRWLAQDILKPDDPAFFVYLSEVCDTSRFGAPRCSDLGSAGAVDRERARAAAVGEAVERYCSAFYEDSSFTFAAYRDLPPQTAVDPETFALFSERQYARPDFHFQPFRKDTQVNWVESFSLISEKPRLVPASFVYLPYQHPESEPCLNVSISTGLACANTLEEALLTALCETIERDAFMLTWLHRFPAPRVSLENCRDETLLRVLECLKWAGLEFHISLITTDIAIPTFLVVLIDRSGIGPAAAVATRTDLNPTWAVVHALEEATLTWLATSHMMADAEPLRSKLSGGASPTLLTRGKYLLRYARQEMLPTFDFLLRSPVSRALSDLPNRATADVLENLRTCVKLVQACGFDALAVDVTTPDIAELGFSVARVIVPGLQPLDMDELRPYRGGKRLYDAPRLLGYSDRVATENDIFEEPHPFP
jgi:ribosomal protein S12 methylthiotransferase accessory factor